jgi:hypothetical protein
MQITKSECAEKCYADIMNLHGVSEFKELVRWLKTFKQNHESLPKGSIPIPSYLWVMKRGGGLMTCLDLFSEYLYATSLINFTGLEKCFILNLEYVNPKESFNELTRIDNQIVQNAGYYSKFQGVICIDINAWGSFVNEPYFKIFLRYIDSKKYQFLTILYIDDHADIESVEASISGSIRYDKIIFSFPKSNDLVDLAEISYLQPLNCSFSVEAKQIFVNIIEDIRDQENFNGFVTLEHVTKDILFHLFKSDMQGSVISADIMTYYLRESDYIKQVIKTSDSELSKYIL